MIKILREQSMQISRWTGGTTKQLYIYPEDADYASRNFMMRLSIATTELEQSNFTPLEGVDRVISILEGKLELSHKGHHTSLLKPHDIDRFKGEWESFAIGKVKDFNLMLKGCKGDFFFKALDGHEKIIFPVEKGIFFMYCISGKVELESCTLQQGELLITDQQVFNVHASDAKIFYGYANIVSEGGV